MREVVRTKNCLRRYTDEENQLILDKVYSDKKIANLLGRTVSAIQSQRHILTATIKGEEMPRGIPINEATKLQVAMLYKEGKTQREIAQETNIADYNVSKILKAYGLTVEEEKANVQDSETLKNIEARLEGLVDELVWFKDKIKTETLEMQDIGFKEVNGTWVSTNMKVNLGSSRIITFYILRNKGRSDEKWEAMSLDPKLIEAVWTEMKSRGWDWYK